MRTRACAFASLTAVLCGCGYVADPQPPSLNIPAVVTNLTAQQRGDKLEVNFDIPPLTTDGVVLTRLGGVELRGGPGTGPQWDPNRWMAQARKVDADAEKPGPFHMEVPVENWVGHTIVAGVRVAGPKGKFSGWSNLVTLPIVQPLAQPQAVRAEAAPEGVRLDWQTPAPTPGVSFRIYRRAPDQKDTVVLASAEKPPYVDPGTQYGKEYTYSVQAMQNTGSGEAVSEVSQPVSIVPKDTFPPAVPAGLAAIPATDSIQLNWDPNAEPDLKGYRIYRAANGGPIERIAETDTPNYGDRAIEAGKKYRYTVSAVDQLGNESAPSAPVEAAAP